FGPIYWVFTATNYALVLSALVLLLRGRRTASALTRVQSLPLAIALIAPVITNVALISGIAPRAYDPMPFGVAVTALLLWWGAWRGRLLELVPLARGRLVDSLTDGILILDLEGRILDANPRLRALLDRSADSLVGQTLDATLDVGTALGAAVRSAAQARAVTSVRHGASVFDVRAVPVPDHAGQVRAQVIVLQEVTERHELQVAQARLIEELRDALAQVRTLRGLLPICASCKCIRDDEGQWRTLELYISERTEADFTHGLCPTCITTLYPDDAGTGATR
ncbi:MAG: PAS domain-containing protein, partial [Gemmatimonadaceae bacterium]|nr:PAS domain-containing protein [Gemmatimonadaceae bacterium]